MLGLAWLVIITMVTMALFGTSCRRRPRDELAAQLLVEQTAATPVTASGGKPTLPPLILNDDTKDLSLTWVDAKGDAHLVDKLTDVPAEGRDQVRVVIDTREDGTGDVFYIANLNAKTPEGAYPITVMSRTDWDSMIAKRREEMLKARAAAAAPPDPALGAGSDDTPGAAGSIGSGAQPMPTVIVYGASWCGACHQAMEYLKRRHVPAIEKDIERDPAADAEMRKKLARVGKHGSSIPIIDVRGKILVGFDPQAIEHALAGPAPSTVAL